MKNLFLFIFLSTLFFSSCIQDEALNSEADILEFSLPDSITYAKASVSNSDIILYIKRGVDITKISPVISLTPGAVLSPNLPHYDLTKIDKITVKSEDMAYSKKYKIHVIIPDPIITEDPILEFNFEDWNDGDKGKFGYYPQLMDKQWQSGNLGIWTIDMSVKNKIFPTKDTTNCVEGEKALSLKTRKGKKAFGQDVPIFSGSLFYGVFTLVQADPPTGVLFGQPFPEIDGKLKRFTGYYKYFPGDVYTDKDGNTVEGKTDECTIRAFLYRVRKGALTGPKGEDYLNGRDDPLTAEQVVAIADLKDTSKKEEFTKFDLLFDHKDVIDYQKYDYRFAIVLASSKRGDFYEGSVGSLLIVDDVKVICEKKEE